MKLAIAVVVLPILCSLPVLADPATDRVTQLAQECGDALVQGDYTNVVRLTHPTVVDGLGGPDKMIALLANGYAELKSNGLSFVSCKVERPHKASGSGSRLYAIVPEEIKINGPNGTLTKRSFVVAVGETNSESWTFVDGMNLNSQTVQVVFPDFPKDLQIPELAQTIIEQKK